VTAIELDPVVRAGELAIRLETLGLAATVVVACVLGALIARRTPATAGRLDGEPLQPGDLVFVVLAAIPGAVIGGRLGYGLIHLDYYSARPAALLDPGQGSLELVVGVVGAALTGGYAARLLTGSVGPWFHVAAFPTLLVIGAGKIAMAFGGTGQGLPNGGSWATSYLGAGPWGSLAPELPSHPAQLYEAAATALVAVGLLAASALGAFRRADGTAWLVGVAGWAAARTFVASIWRDAPVLGPLVAGQLLAIALFAGSLGLVVALRRPRPVRWPRGVS